MIGKPLLRTCFAFFFCKKKTALTNKFKNIKLLYSCNAPHRAQWGLLAKQSKKHEHMLLLLQRMHAQRGRKEGRSKCMQGAQRPLWLGATCVHSCCEAHDFFNLLSLPCSAPVRSMGGVRHAQGATLMATVRKPLWLGATPLMGMEVKWALFFINNATFLKVPIYLFSKNPLCFFYFKKIKKQRGDEHK